MVNASAEDAASISAKIVHEIAALAYEKWIARGRQNGSELRNWLDAETEVQRLRELIRQLASAEEQLQCQALERRIARDIQQGLLPKQLPTLAGFEIAGRSVAANSVGGDCFDFIPWMAAGEECLGVFVGDASGHGIGAALLMVDTRAYLRALALTCTDVGKLLTLCNHRLAGDRATDQFVTLFLLRLEPSNRCLVYAGAGHWPAYVLNRWGQMRAVLASEGPPLGIDPASEFPASTRVVLEAGDLVFLFTDGIPEAFPPDGAFFGVERALTLVRQHQDEPAEAILEALFAAVQRFADHRLQDDLTAVIIKCQ